MRLFSLVLLAVACVAAADKATTDKKTEDVTKETAKENPLDVLDQDYDIPDFTSEQKSKKAVVETKPVVYKSPEDIPPPPPPGDLTPKATNKKVTKAAAPKPPAPKRKANKKRPSRKPAAQPRNDRPVRPHKRPQKVSNMPYLNLVKYPP